MKKFLYSLIFLLSILVVIGCRKEEPEIDKYKEHKEIFALVNNYSVSETNGFDYSLEQKLNEVVTNSHSITLRIDKKNEIKASRVEVIKNLNEDVSLDQYTTSNITTYYKNNKVYFEENNEWKTKDITFDEFSKAKVGSFSFDIDSLNDISLSKSGNNQILTFKVSESNSKTFLNIESNVKDLTFKIVTDSSITKLISVDVSYSLDVTNTSFSFVPYYGDISISIPE